DPPLGQKPSVTLTTLIHLSIVGSSNHRLSLQEIFCSIEWRFEFFRNNSDKKWQ
ncbi:hypothetical protein GYMLUDRAFT_105417, partial [Collybiopsis luxurians FD-317 M1]